MLTFDFETTNHSYGSALDKRNRILMVSWAVGSGKIKSYRGDIMKAREFWHDLSKERNLCAYYAKFEMLWLLRCGFDIDDKQWHDPMLAEKVKQANKQVRYAMSEVAERYDYPLKDPMIDSMMKAGLCPSEMPQKRLQQRCVRDVRVTRMLLKKILTELKVLDQLHLYRTRCDFQKVLALIENEGMLLDAPRVDAEYNEQRVALAAIENKLSKLTGGVNMNSPKQKGAFLYDTLKFPEPKTAGGKNSRTKAGGRKTDAATLLWLAGKCSTVRQAEFIELSRSYSKKQAAVSKNLEFFQGVCREYDGELHAQFHQTVAATDRLTSSGLPLKFQMFDGATKSVQFQNMPRAFKRLFRAPAGYEMVEVDAVQLEFRVAAYLGQDKQAMKDIANPDFDAHVFSASEIYGKDYMTLLAGYRAGNKAVKELRQLAKPHTFKPLYGGKKGTPGEERYYAEFARRYEGVVAVQEDWLAEVLRTDALITPWGKRFYWQTYMDRRGVAMDRRTHKPVAPQVANYPVQNLATAEIVPIAITALVHRCKIESIDVKFVNTIHDSVVAFVKGDAGTLSRFREAAEWAFTTAVYEHLELFYNIKFNVPLGIEMTRGTFWGEGTQTTHDDVLTWSK